MTHKIIISCLAIFSFLISSQVRADFVIDDFSTAVAQIEASGFANSAQSPDVAHTVLTIAGQRYLLAQAIDSASPFAAGSSQVEIAANILTVNLSNTPTSFTPPETIPFNVEFPSGLVNYDNYASAIDFTSFTENAFQIDVASSLNADLQILIKDSNGDESFAFKALPDSVGPQTVLFNINTDFSAIGNTASITDIVSIQVRIDLTNTDTSGGNQMASAELSKISFVAHVPEPGMLGLAGLGAACIACYRRRKYDDVQFETKESVPQERF